MSGREPLESRVPNQEAPSITVLKEKRGGNDQFQQPLTLSFIMAVSCLLGENSLQMVFIKEDGEKEQQCLL